MKQVIKEVYVFSIEGDHLIVLDREAKETLKVNVKGYDRLVCEDLIGTKILIEEIDGEYFFGGTEFLRKVMAMES